MKNQMAQIGMGQMSRKTAKCIASLHGHRAVLGRCDSRGLTRMFSCAVGVGALAVRAFVASHDHLREGR